MEQKIIVENIENNRVFCIDSRKTYVMKSIEKIYFSKSVTLEGNTSIFYFSFFFGLFIKTMTKETVFLTISQEKVY